MFLCFFTRSCATVSFVFLSSFFPFILLLVLSVSLPLTFSNVKILSDGLFERLRDRLDVDRSERQRKHDSILHQRRSWSTSAAKPSKHVVDIACRLVVPHSANHSRVLNFVFQVHPKSDALSSQIKAFSLVIEPNQSVDVTIGGYTCTRPDIST